MNDDPVAAPPPRRPAPPRRGTGWLAFIVVFAVFGAAYFFGVMPRQKSLEALSQETRKLAIPTVAVTSPKAGDTNTEMVLPGNLLGYSETAVYARASGFVRRWTADIGAQVKAGELLAEIEVPEVDADLQRARAELDNARVTYEQAQKTSDRWQALVKTGSVSAQDAEAALDAARARRAAVEAAKQSVSRLERVRGFREVRAPFAGVITARNAEVGELVDAGSGGGKGRELYRLASTGKLRVQVNLPQEAARSAVPGVGAEITLPGHSGKKYPGKIVRTAGAIDPEARTLLAEIEVDNAGGELLPGAYAQVRLKIPVTVPSLIVPVNTLLFRSEGPQVAVITGGDRVTLRNVTIGRDFGTTVELLTGIEASDRVVLNPSDSLSSGVQVRVVQAPEKKSDKADKPERKS
jgi:RND family efflux transporter MFP subunit